MARCRSLLVAVVTLASVLSSLSASKRVASSRTLWTPKTFPNPNTDPQACHRSSPSILCDPDSLLTAPEADSIEAVAVSIRNRNEPYTGGLPDCQSVTAERGGLAGFQIAVAVVRSMDLKAMNLGFFAGKEAAAAKFARDLHDAWGVGDAACQNGVVVFLAMDDRVMYISTGRGVRDIMDDDRVQTVVDAAKPLLRQGEVGAALRRIVHTMGVELAKGKPGFNWLAVGFGLLFAGVVGFGIRTGIRQQKRFKTCKSKLEKLDSDKKLAAENAYSQTSCPICLEDWTPDSNIRTLPCRHKFCDDCAQSWLETNSTCPVCRESAELGLRGRPGNDFRPEMRVRLDSLHRSYPEFVTPAQITIFMSDGFCGPMHSHPSFLSTFQTENSGSSSTSFGGGSSSGGGGAGGGF